MLCSWEVSSLKAWPWRRCLNRKPHLTHLSSVSGSTFLGINAHPLVLFYVAQLSDSWPGCFPYRMWDSLPCSHLYLPAQPLLFPDTLHLLHLKGANSSAKEKEKNAVGNWIIINVCDFGWMAQIPSFSIYFLNSLIDTFLWKHGFVQSFNLV